MDKIQRYTFEFLDEATYRFAFIALKDMNQASFDDVKKQLTITGSVYPVTLKAELAKRINLKKCILVEIDLETTKGDFQKDMLEYLRNCLSSATICLTHPEEDDALHRFRVDLRTLRSFLSYARRLEIAGFSDLAVQLKQLGTSSNAARDNEVMALLFKKYGSKHDVVPISMSIELRDDAIEELRRQACELWLDLIQATLTSSTRPDFHDLLSNEAEKRWKKLKRRCLDLDMKDDMTMHRLRIDLKKLSSVLRLLQLRGYDVSSRSDLVRTLQSELGQIRDLRKFYILPGLDAQTRYRAVGVLTTLEVQFQHRFTKGNF